MITIIYYSLVSKNLTFNMRWDIYTRAQLLFSFLYKHEKELDFFVSLFFQTKFIFIQFHKKNFSTHTLVAIQKVQSFVRFGEKQKKEEIEHTQHIEKKHLSKI